MSSYSSKSNNRARSLAFKSRRHRSGVGMASARGKPEDADPADAPRRADAERSMPSRASPGDDDVGALTPARAPGTSADDAQRATTSQERARAGLESIRRADAAVEAARETARARAAERARARAEAERYAAAADALAAETRARVADDFAPLVGELSRARFFRDADGDPVAFSRIAGPADDAGDAPARRPDADEDAVARSVQRRGDDARAREAPRVVDRPVENVAVENVAENVPERGGNVATASFLTAATEIGERDAPDPPPSLSRRRWSPARSSVDALRATVGDEAEEPSREGARRGSARRALSMPGRRGAEDGVFNPSTSKTRNTPPRTPPRSARDCFGEKKPAVPRFSELEPKPSSTQTKTATKRTETETETRLGKESRDPSRRPMAFVGATATGAAMCARLLDAGFPVVLAPPTIAGFADDAEKRRAATLARHGATLARSPRHAAELAVFGAVEKDGACAGFLPRAWAPGVRARDRRDAARRGQAPPQPTPVLVLRPGAEEEDDSFSGGDDDDDEDEEHEDRETDAATRKRKNTLPSTNLVARLRALDASTRAALEDIFAPRSPRAAVQNRASFGGSLLVLNVNSATRKGALRNFQLLVTVLGVSFAQAATRGDPVDAEDGKMRVAVAAADVVAYEKRRDEKNRRQGRPSVPSIKFTGSMCALKGAERVKCLSELDRVLRAFGERKDRLVVGAHPADAAVVGGGDPRDDDDDDDDDDDASRADSLSYVRGAGGFADDASEASEAASEVSEAASEAAADDDQVSAQSASGRRSLPEKPLGAKYKYISAAAARAWRLADARATARARERHAVATAPALERLAFLERELERVSSQARGVEVSLRRALEESDAERATLRAALDGAAETSRTDAASLAASERRIAELRDTLASANADAAASRRDATTAARRYETTERELGETLVALEDERREKETMKADFLAAEASAKAEAEEAMRALVVERAELELTLKRRLEETEATARATAMRDEAEGKIKRAENVAAAATASADAGARAAAEAVATLRSKLERAESERALARGGEARAIASLEAAEAEVKATKKVLERVEKDASERVRRARASSQETRAEKEDAEARADAADALAASLEKSADEARRASVAARREFSARERALLAERDAARAELAASKAAARRATREAEKLAAFVREVRENGGTLPANARWDDTKPSGSPWRPPGASPARATVSSAAKKVSLEGLVATKGALASPGPFFPERVPPPTSPSPASRASLPSSPSSPSPVLHTTAGTENDASRGPGSEKSASRGINAARLEAAETRVARLETALAKADGEVAAARDAALEKLASVRAELARRTAERDGLFARHQAQTRLVESRAAERREAASLAETLALEKATLESRLNELLGLRHASDRVAERFAKDRAESSSAVASLRAEKDALAKELDETLARFAALGGAEATARAEREAAEEAAEHAKMEARRFAEEVESLKKKLDASTVERARAETELLGFKNGAFARAAVLRVAEATRANDEKHEARAEMLRAEAAFARAGAEAAATAARAELRDVAARERDAVAEAAAAAAEAAELGKAVDAELERTNRFLPETENRATPTRNRARVASSPSRLRSRFPETSSEAEKQTNPAIFTPRAARLDAMRRARLELARVVPTRRALELALEQPDVLEALDALRFGHADPSPAAALACHLVRAVLDGDASFETSEKKETSESEDIAAAVLGDAFFTLERKNENAEKSFLGKSTSPASVRAALARCVAGDVGRTEFENETSGDDTAYTSAAAAAAEFSAAFDAIRPALGRTLPSRMRGVTLNAANERGLRDATRAVRALMMGGGFGAFATGDECGDDDDDDDVGSRSSNRSNGFGPGSNDPLAEALFRWSACAVREWRLRRRAADAEKALARAEAEEEEEENGFIDAIDADVAAASGSPERFFNAPAPSPSRGKGKRHPLVVRAPASPVDARKIATHGAARALAKRERA